MAFERKIIGLDACEVKLAGGDDGAPVTVEGYGSVFNTSPDSYGDVIAPGAYGKTVAAIEKRGWLTMKYDHYQGIGKWTEVREDRRGLFLKGELTPGHSGAADVAALLKHGAIAGLSIGFRAIKAIRDAKGIRTLQEIDLSEVSIVHDPAQRQAGITAVKADEISSVREFEAFLRDAGYSRREAEQITEKGFKAWLRAREEPSAGDSTDERRDDGKAVEEWLEQLRKLRRAS